MALNVVKMTKTLRFDHQACKNNATTFLQV